MQLAVFESLTFNAPRSLRRACGVVWFSICLLSAPLMAQDFSNEACANAHDKNQESLAPNRQILEASPLPNRQPKRTIHHIELVQLNVFNTDLPEENNALFRFANRAHIQTEAEVIKQVLLFQEGDEYLPEKLMESERLLRQQRYLYDARIYADVACEGDIHVTVVTRDLWTLLPDLGFSHSGGESKSRIGFRETNLLGKGKRLSLTYTTDESRKGYLFVYEDPNIWGSRYTGRLDYADNDDGQMHMLSMAYPFYALDTPYAYGFATSSNKRTESLYERGEVVHEFSQQTDLHQIYFGHSTTVAKNWTRRLLFGYQEDKERFTSLLASTRALPSDRSARYPYIEYNWLENAYVKVRNVDSIFRTEDLQLGWNISAKLGYSDKGLSDDESRWLYWLFASKSHYVNDRSLIKFSALSQGAWKVDSSDAENQLLQLGLQYYYNDSATESWFANLEYQHIRKMTLDKQLTLGGETGLRGYPAHYIQGDSKWLLNLEKRYYWEYDLWQLFKVGGALFVDIGKTTGKPLFQPELGTLSDAGFGLRLAPSRANSNLMLHMDIAWPIQKDEKVDSMQWQFTVKNRF